MGCVTFLMKYIVFLFNFIFVVGGIAMVVLGALTYMKFEQYDDLVASLGLSGFRGPPIAMMVVGGIVFLIAFLGCCGAMRENHVLMSSYGTILTLLLILQVAVVILIALNKDDVENALQTGFTDSMQKYGGSNAKDKEITATWDNMQENLKCCGAQSFKNWNTVGKKVPATCCQAGKNSCPEGLSFPVENLDLIHTEGCYEKALHDIGIPLSIAIAAGIGGVEMLGVIFSFRLAARFGNKANRS